MITRKTDLREIERQLNPLYYEISMLKFRVEESGPKVSTLYRSQVSSMSAQYKFLEAQVQNLKAEKDIPEEQILRAEKNLRELQKTLNTIGQWIFMETANQICTYY
jgi:chromosome segregation ATPase